MSVFQKHKILEIGVTRAADYVYINWCDARRTVCNSMKDPFDDAPSGGCAGFTFCHVQSASVEEIKEPLS